MRKITLLIICLIGYASYGQVNISETFDSSAGDFTGSYSNSTEVPCDVGSMRDNLYEYSATGNLTSANQAGVSNGTDLNVSFDYKILDYPASFYDPPGPATGPGWGSADVQYSTDGGTSWTTVLTIDDDNHVASLDCATMMATIPAASLPNGSDVQLRISNTWLAGDYYFYVDNFSATQVALTPPNCDSSLTITSDVGVEGDISWSTATGVPTGYNLTVGSSSGASDILATTDIGNVTTYNLGTLSYTTTYYVTIEPYNANGTATGCVEQTFITEDAPPAGTDCNNPIMVASLPYNTADDTANYGDDYENGSSPCSGFYMSGDDVVYSFTPGSDGSYNILMSNIGATYSGIHVLDDCVDGSPNCIGFAGNSGTDDRELDIALTMGTTYYIVISTWATPQSTTYTLDITENTCTAATVAYTVVDDCAVSGGFNIEVDITDMGTATDLTVSDDQGSPTQPATGVTTLTFGPYVNGTDVVITVVDDNDASCTLTSGTLTQAACPPSNDECDDAIALTVNLDYDNTDTTAGTTVGATASSQADDVSGTPNTDVWFSFTAVYSGHRVELLNVVNQGGGTSTSTDMGMGVYDLTGGCGALVLEATSDPNSLDLTDLTPGATYAVRVYGWFTSLQYNNFDISVGSDPALSIDDATLSTFTYYPNPVKNTLTLNAQNNIEDVRMYNMLGQEVMNAQPQAVDSDIDMSSLETGTYFVQVTIASMTKTVRVVKQ